MNATGGEFSIPSTSNVSIVPVADSRAARHFLEYPYSQYRNDPCWVAPLRIDQKRLFDSAVHPFWKRARMQRFLAFQGDRLCGRVAAIHDELAGEGTFGFFESIDSQPVASSLLASAADWLASRGLERMRGPMNPSINYECGLLVDGFDAPPRLMTTYNPPYYERLFETAGLSKAHDLYAYRSRLPLPAQWETLERARRRHRLPGLTIRSARLDDFDKELDHVWRIYSSAWSENWGATPLTNEEMRFVGKELKPLINPEFVKFCELEGETIAFGLAVPDLNLALRHARGSLFPTGLAKILYHKRRIRKARFVLLGILKPYRRTSIAADLCCEITQAGVRLGFDEAECSWVSEANSSMIRTLQFLGAERYKTYRIYETALQVRGERVAIA